MESEVTEELELLREVVNLCIRLDQAVKTDSVSNYDYFLYEQYKKALEAYKEWKEKHGK